MAKKACDQINKVQMKALKDKYMEEKKMGVKMMALAHQKPVMLMAHTAKIALTPMIAQLHALQMNINALQEPMS